MWQAGATLHHGARASHHRGPSRCGAQAPDAQAQQPWLTGPAAPRHAGSSQTRARTRVPCISRQTPNHCATREALFCFSYWTILCENPSKSPVELQFILLNSCVKFYRVAIAHQSAVPRGALEPDHTGSVKACC